MHCAVSLVEIKGFNDNDDDGGDDHNDLQHFARTESKMFLMLSYFPLYTCQQLDFLKSPLSCLFSILL